MRNLSQPIYGVIPQHMLDRVAQHCGEAAGDARATLEHMRELATRRARNLAAGQAAVRNPAPETKKRRHVYDAQNQLRLPGKLVMSEHKARSADVEVNEAYDGAGVIFDFYAKVFGRTSIDGRGMRLDSTVHYGHRFDNAMWNGHQMVYGDGDGVVFRRFTICLDVIGHELAHGVTQHSAALGYSDQTGALNEHLSDAFAIMARQWMLGQTARESDWLIGEGLFMPGVKGKAIRSMAAPGTAYDDPILGRDPQPSHMDHFVETDDDNGGVHINSGIPNFAFYKAATTMGGAVWEVLGRIWYQALLERLKPKAGFADFARATVDIAGERYGNGGRVQRLVSDAWAAVGLEVALFKLLRISRRQRSDDSAAPQRLPKWRQRPTLPPPAAGLLSKGGL